MVLKMARYYNQKNVMVEQNYITPMEFMSSMLELVEELGMLPPPMTKHDPGHFPGDGFDYEINDWEDEDEKI
jgi:hypothetical protein